MIGFSLFHIVNCLGYHISISRSLSLLPVGLNYVGIEINWSLVFFLDSLIALLLDDFIFIAEPLMS